MTTAANALEYYGDAVSTYSRKQAIDDGFLIDISNSAEAKEAGIKYPCAVSLQVWDKYIEWTEQDTKNQTYQDKTGRLWDIVSMMRFAIRANKNTSEIIFPLYCVPRDGKSTQPIEIRLKVTVGPGDKAEPVMTIDLASILDEKPIDIVDLESEDEDPESNVIPLTQFIQDFGSGLMKAVQEQNPPIHDGTPVLSRDQVMNELKRKPFDAQKDVVQAACKLLIDHNAKASVLNCDMGTGKTMMAIATSSVFHAEGAKRFLVLAPPHLVYKWRREIHETVDNAKVWILNGPDTLSKLLMLRESLDLPQHDGPEYFILGRVRMRLGFHWKPAFSVRKKHYKKVVNETDEASKTFKVSVDYVACSKCGSAVLNNEGENIHPESFKADKRRSCDCCGDALWTLVRPGKKDKTHRDIVHDAMCQIPTIGPKTADKLLGVFGETMLGNMLSDNIYEFVNLMDEKGEFVFSDRQAKRIERSMAKMELSFGQGGYQPTEFIKRYLPQGYFDMLICDEGHEYKNSGSAQGQAMGVLATKASKILLLTGTLMAGYADDLFYLLWRIMPKVMIEDGYKYNERGSLGSACLSFMREHGVLKDVYKETESESHRTAKGKRVTVRTTKAPGFGPKGIARYVLPYTVFLKLKDIGQDVLPSYDEHFIEVPLSDEQQDQYQKMQTELDAQLRKALACGDTTLLGLVISVLLAWPDCCFREEAVVHPRSRALLHFVPSLFDEDDLMPKEEELIKLCQEEKAQGRRVLVYTTYTGKRDTGTRLAKILKSNGIKSAVLRSTVDTGKREDWIMDQVDRGIDVLICNPELVKTGLDLLDFPTIVFMQTGYNTYTVQQASKRSWRIGQMQSVKVYFFGYAETAQMTCLSLMSKKIAVSQSTAGEMPESGLDILNDDGDSIEVELAKQLLKEAA